MEILTQIQLILSTYFQTLAEHMQCSKEHLTIVFTETKYVALELLQTISSVDYQNFM